MSCTGELLAKVARNVEAEIQPRLQGFFGGMLRAYLPQSWEFRTEEGAHTLTVDAAGRASVKDGAPTAPDVTVEAPHDRLRTALTNGTKLPETQVRVTPHTAKGRTALGLVRSRLGV